MPRFKFEATRTDCGLNDSVVAGEVSAADAGQALSRVEERLSRRADASDVALCTSVQEIDD